MKSLSLVSSLCLVILLVSCSKDDCECPSSQGGGSTDPRDQYLGNYAVRDSATFSGQNFFIDEYTMVISKTADDSDTLLFLNIANSGEEAYGLLSGSIYILPEQEVDFGLQGEGAFSGDQLSHQLLTDDGFVSRTGQGMKFE